MTRHQTQYAFEREAGEDYVEFIVTVTYDFVKGYDQTWEEPGCDDEFDIINVVDHSGAPEVELGNKEMENLLEYLAQNHDYDTGLCPDRIRDERIDRELTG